MSSTALVEEIAIRASLTAEYHETPRDMIKYLPMDAINGVSSSDAEAMVEIFGVYQLGDLSDHPILQRLLYLNTVC